MSISSIAGLLIGVFGTFWWVERDSSEYDPLFTVITNNPVWAVNGSQECIIFATTPLPKPERSAYTTVSVSTSGYEMQRPKTKPMTTYKIFILDGVIRFDGGQVQRIEAHGDSEIEILDEGFLPKGKYSISSLRFCG